MRRTGNPNLDDPDDYRELNLTIKNYVFAEFIAVPENFNLDSHLSMRERVGIYKVKDITKPTIQVMVDSIKVSPVFCTMNNSNLNPKNCFFLLQLFKELGLIVTSIDNPFRKYMDDNIYDSVVSRWEEDRHNLVRGQAVQSISFLFINVYYMMFDEVCKEVMENMQRIYEWQLRIDSTPIKGDHFT